MSLHSNYHTNGSAKCGQMRDGQQQQHIVNTTVTSTRVCIVQHQRQDSGCKLLCTQPLIAAGNTLRMRRNSCERPVPFRWRYHQSNYHFPNDWLFVQLKCATNMCKISTSHCSFWSIRPRPVQCGAHVSGSCRLNEPSQPTRCSLTSVIN